MENFLLIIQGVLGLGLIILVLIQARGTGFSRSFGASTTSFNRRGLEKFLFRLTFIFAALFIAISILQLVN